MSDLVTFNPSRALDGNLKAVPGALAYFYDTGTTNPRTVYADAGLSVPHPTPLVANAVGIFAQVFVDGGPVRAVVKTSAGVTLWDLDPAVKVPSGGAGAATVAFTPTPEVPATNVQDAISLLGDAKLIADDFMAGETVIGQAIRTAPSTTTAQTALGGTAVGRGVFGAASTSAARAAIGFAEGLNATGSAPTYACRAWVDFHGDPTNGTYSRAGTLITVTMTAHGMSTGMVATLDFTTGAGTDAAYSVTAIDANTFTVVDAASGTTSGNVTRNAYCRARGNVGYVARNAQGDYTLYFVTNLPSADYAVNASSMVQSGAGANVVAGVLGTGTYSSPTPPLEKTAAAVRIGFQSSAGNMADVTHAFISIIC